MSVRTREKENNAGWTEDIRYHDNIPDEVIGELTPEMIGQYYLWDEVTKKEIQRHPRLLLPLIKEIFHKEYPEGVRITLAATEYVVRRIHRVEGSTLNSIFADIAVQVGDRDMYHLECQMNKDKEMVLRMLEYDMQIGMAYGLGSLREGMTPEDACEVRMPRSVILYLNHLDNAPSEERCLIRFADGSTHEYRVPVMKVQSYTAEMIEEKHLNMLIPFLPIRFRRYLNRKKGGVRQAVSETARKGLTEFIGECMMIIEREKENGTLTDMEGKDIIDFLSIACGYLFESEPVLKEEVLGMMKPIVQLQSERAEKAERELEEIRPIVQLQSERAEKAERELEEIKPVVQLQSERAEKAERELEEIKPVIQLQSERAEKAEQKIEEMRPIIQLQTARADKAEQAVDASIKKFIERARSSGQPRQDVKESIQDIFSLNEKEAGEKLHQYWKH